MIVNTSVITNRIRAMAGDRSLTLNLCEEKIAATSGKVIYLQRPHFDWTKDQLTIWESSAYHEIGHCAPNNRDIFDIIHEHKVHMKSRFGLALNVLDDLRQEAEQYGTYTGRDRVMGEGNRLTMDEHIDSGRLEDTDDDEGKAFLAACFGYMTYVFEWYPAMAGMYDRILGAVTPAVREKIEHLVDHDDEINPLGCDGVGVYERSKRLLELLGFDPEKEEEDAKDKTKAEKQLSEAAEEFKKEILKHLHSDRDIEEHAEDGEPTGLMTTSSREEEEKEKLPEEIPPDFDGYHQSNWSDMVIEDYSRKPAGDTPHVHTAELVHRGMFLGTHVRKLLQTMSQIRTVHGLKRGKMSSKSIYRATMRKSGEYQKKIFKQKTDAISLDVAVQLVVDGSGSMRSAGKYEAASASAVIMSKVLTDLRIKHEVIVFTEVQRAGEAVLRHGIIKSFDKGSRPEQLMSNFSCFKANGLEQNLDGESILWSAMRLLKEVSARKIMIVFSDGQPAAHRRGAAAITRDVIAELQLRRDMEIYGIGIMSQAVDRYYRDHTVINDTAELEKGLLTVIKTKILKG